MSLANVSQKDFSRLMEVTIQGSNFVNQRRPTQNKDPAKIPAKYDWNINQSQDLT